jgi:hypothetical protein
VLELRERNCPRCEADFDVPGAAIVAGPLPNVLAVLLEAGPGSVSAQSASRVRLGVTRTRDQSIRKRFGWISTE